MPHRKKLRSTDLDLLSDLPDDILLLVLSKLASSSSSPSDFLTILSTCKRLNRLAMNPTVLINLSADAMAVQAKNWSVASHLFLRRSVLSGNGDAHYILGMIRFYCLEMRASGASLLAKAAMKNHASSLYSLALIHFNASGKSKEKKDPQAGFVLCARAAYLGSITAIRELGHVLLDIYNEPSRGHRLILQASLKELRVLKRTYGVVGSLHMPDPAHRFLRQWFECKKNGDVLCSNEVCGRAETRVREFRRCGVCGVVKYCSRGCQTVHWRTGHKDVCVVNGVDEGVEEVEGNVNVDFDGGVELGVV